MKVSIIIPYKDDRGYLDKAIESIEKQSYKNYEVILSQSDNRVGYNLNRGIEKATGDLIRYLCDDDMLTDNSLFDTVNRFSGDFIHSNAFNFYENGRVYRHIPKIKNPRLIDLKRKNHFHGGTVVYHASVFDRFGLFDEDLWTGEEYDFNLKLLHSGAQVGYVNAFTYFYRRHSLQKSIGNTDSEYQKKRQEVIQQIKQRYI
jgi:glycosyltransferase involved in cell wall biosynthesis